MQILVLGPGCSKCIQAETNVRNAVKITGVDADIRKVSNIMEMLKLGVVATPSIVIDGVNVCCGYVPTVDQIVDLLNKYNK